MENKRIVIEFFGMPRAGKSTQASIIASKLGWSFPRDDRKKARLITSVIGESPKGCSLTMALAVMALEDIALADGPPGRPIIIDRGIVDAGCWLRLGDPDPAASSTIEHWEQEVRKRYQLYSFRFDLPAIESMSRHHTSRVHDPFDNGIMDNPSILERIRKVYLASSAYCVVDGTISKKEQTDRIMGALQLIVRKEIINAERS